MSNESEPTNLLGEDLTGVDTSMPLVAPGLYTLEVVKLEQATNKRGDGVNLNMHLKTTEETTSTTGEPIGAGYPIYHTLSQTPTERFTPQMIKKRNASLLESLQGSVEGSLLPLDRFDGRRFLAKIGIEESSNYPAKNVVKTFLKAK
jgi:hypothetical protein